MAQGDYYRRCLADSTCRWCGRALEHRGACCLGARSCGDTDMKLRRVKDGGGPVVQVAGSQGWVALADVLARLSPQPSKEDAARWSCDLVSFLGAPAGLLGAVGHTVAGMPAQGPAD